MQSKDMEEKMQRLIKKMPFVKGVILIDREGDAEVFCYQAKDLEFNVTDQHFFSGLRGGIN